jgi:hypothetical protein
LHGPQPHIELGIGAASDRKEINRLSRLGVRDDPNLEVIPVGARGAKEAGTGKGSRVRTLTVT